MVGQVASCIIRRSLLHPDDTADPKLAAIKRAADRLFARVKPTDACIGVLPCRAAHHKRQRNVEAHHQLTCVRIKAGTLMPGCNSGIDVKTSGQPACFLRWRKETRHHAQNTRVRFALHGVGRDIVLSLRHQFALTHFRIAEMRPCKSSIPDQLICNIYCAYAKTRNFS